MKRNFFMMAFVSLFTVVALCSCGKDEEENDDNGGNGENTWIQGNTITAVVENGTSYSVKIETVKAQVEHYDYYTTLASVPYINTGFILTLPESLNDQHLEPFSEEKFDDITVSNPNVKAGWVRLLSYKSGSDYTGYFYYGTEGLEGEPVYADGDVSITGTKSSLSGTEKWTEKWNVHLKKGWNIWYAKETVKANDLYEYEYATQVPEGAKWHFHDYSSSSTSGSLRKQVSPLSAKHKLRFLSESGFSGLKD